MPAGERVERVDQDLCVANLTQRSRGVAERRVLSPVGALAQGVAQQTERRARSLDVLASVVDFLVRRRPDVGEMFERLLRLRADRATDGLGCRFPPTKRCGHAVPRLERPLLA